MMMTTVFAAFTASVLVLAAAVLAAGCMGSAPETASPVNITGAPVQTVHVGDIDIAYKTVGTGDAIIMIMGFAGTMDLWSTGLIERLAEDHRVIVFDNRGMGLTTASDAPFSLELFADDTAGLMSALNISRAHVLGWSMGADIAQELAFRHPERVDSLILVSGDSGGSEAVQPTPEVLARLTDTTGTPREQGARLLSLLFPSDWFADHPDLFSYFPEVTESSSPESIGRQATAMATWNGTYDRLSEITQKTLVVTGTDDIITPPKNAFILGERIPGAWVVQFKGAGHGLMYQDPDGLAEAVLFFIGA
ncbi:alpha/beta hydrolase [Methanoculleus sp.]|uniref:alpha/beta fold hydrolase n=1 Tax=Methanoculleus sp. TaxID=90427 RepID=UPI0025D086F1|nr:alpha/beta hydrolase [Methanoculleus sp.]